ncbi:MAG TPA: universal stress protein [Candidatus Angelobacter sp.]|nr:universal stress protein [Candidatus Angelobacter sp.]
MNAVAIPILPAVRLKNILYATDFSEASRAALPIVATIARKYGSQVLAAHVWTAQPYTMVSPEELSLLDGKEEGDARAVLESFVRIKELEGISVTPLVTCGDAARELSRIVRQKHIDLAILSTHGRTGFKRLLLGSVAEELFRSLPCPVLTVGPHISSRFATQTEVKEVLFPTDLSIESGGVFPYLASLSSESAAHMTLLHVVPGEDRRHPSAMDEHDSLCSAMQRMFCPKIDPRCKVKLVVEAGDPVERILAHSRADKADLIGFGVRKTGQISTHFRNSVPYKVVLGAECPVLTSHLGANW